MNHRVLFLVPYPPHCAPSQRLKFEQHIPYLEAHGFSVEFRPFMTPSFYRIAYQPGRYAEKVAMTLWRLGQRLKDVADARKFDVIYLHLELVPFGPPMLEWLLSKTHRRIIYDIDDIISIPHASASNWVVQYIRSKHKAPAIARASHHVIVVTSYLRTLLEPYSRRVTYIPPTIDTDRYTVRPMNGHDDLVRIGWSGSHSTSAYLQLIAGALRRVQQRYRNVRVVVIGDPTLKIPGVMLEARPWRLETEVDELQRFNIGLYPLPEIEWALGKGGLKALQYMGVGVPAVCTRFGACTEFIRHGENGFLVDGEEEWVSALSQLIEDVQLRRGVGLAGRQTVEERFAVKVHSPTYLRIIQEACGVFREGEELVPAFAGTSEINS